MVQVRKNRRGTAGQAWQKKVKAQVFAVRWEGEKQECEAEEEAVQAGSAARGIDRLWQSAPEPCRREAGETL